MSLFGVYWEYRYDFDDTVSSFLFIPEYLKKKGRNGEQDSQAATIMYRAVSNSSPQKAWRYHTGKPTNAGMLGAHGDPSTLAVQMIPQIAIFSDAVIQAVDGNPDFEIRNEPIFVELTDQELESITEGATPRSLTARIFRARTAAGYPTLPGKED